MSFTHDRCTWGLNDGPTIAASCSTRIFGGAAWCADVPAGRTRGQQRRACRLRPMSFRRHLSLSGLVLMLAGSGILHLAKPRLYRTLVPRPLARWRSQAVAVSGLVEIICALLLVMPKTRPVGAYASASLLVAVFPANVQAALDGGYRGEAFPANSRAVAWLRLPLQGPLIWWALSFRHPPHGRPSLISTRVQSAAIGAVRVELSHDVASASRRRISRHDQLR